MYHTIYAHIAINKFNAHITHEMAVHPLSLSLTHSLTCVAIAHNVQRNTMCFTGMKVQLHNENRFKLLLQC